VYAEPWMHPACTVHRRWEARACAPQI
jgi:hypothetical protein